MAELPELPCIKREDLEKYMKKYFKSNSGKNKEFSILVVGETGSGKSTLINNLLGQEVALVGHTVESSTSEIAHHNGVVEGVPVCLYDTPGLGDSRSDMDEKILADMKKALESTDIDVVIFCFKMSEIRFRNSLVDIFIEYDKIGVKWQHTVIALTFADALPKPRSAMKAAKEKGEQFSMKKFFNEKIEEWETALKKVLQENFKVTHVKICATTDTINEDLPNGQRWYVPFWLDVLEILNPGAKMAFLEMHQQKICDDGSYSWQPTEEECRRLHFIIIRDMMLQAIIDARRKILETMLTRELLQSVLSDFRDSKEEDPEGDGEESMS